MNTYYPEKQGLYDPQFEHDSCGVGFIVHMKGEKSHGIITQALELLTNLKHRGALGADPETGDGAGIMIQIPHDFLVEQAQALEITLPDPGKYGAGMVFMPQDEKKRQRCGLIIENVLAEEGLAILGWRDVPTDPHHVGKNAAKVQPVIRQIFVENTLGLEHEIFERKLYVVRKLIQNTTQGNDLYIPSLSSRTMIYKGMLHATQLKPFYPDLSDPKFASALAIVHSRFSTNTFPTWPLAHPFRYLAHNGEINTLRGNINWMNARKEALKSPLYDDISKLFPLIMPHGSDSAAVDNALEFLVLSGYSLPHAVMMLVPEAWQSDPNVSAEKRAFYEYHEQFMEPWDGPASLTFSNGIQIGATLDRNGLRPARYVVTKDHFVVMASEVGAIQIEPQRIERKGRLQPGKMFLVDTSQGRIIDDSELKAQMCHLNPYQEWLDQNMLHLSGLPEPENYQKTNTKTLIQRQQMFGYTQEDIQILIKPMAEKGEEAIGSMGNDVPLAVLSNRPQPLYNYFKQLFAQVTNPPIDSIREGLVMSLISHLGKERNILEQTAAHARLLQLEHPVLTNQELEKIRDLDQQDFRSCTLTMVFNKNEGPSGLEKTLDALCEKALASINEGNTFLILSDRTANEDMVPIPALLAVAAVHHYLIQKGLRTSASIILESGEPREVAHFALLIGYGAGAINPYLAWETLDQMIQDKLLPESIYLEKAIANYKKAIQKGLFKIFSKMGISTIQSYRGAQIFEAIGLAEEVIKKYFRGTASRIQGIPIDVIAQESLARHQMSFEESVLEGEAMLDPGGAYAWRRRGEYHQINPETIQTLQKAVRQNTFEDYQKYTRLVNEQEHNMATIRSLLKFKTGTPVPLEEVEPAKEIVKRFATGAMSFGSISIEAHETLALAMNKIGGKSNSGEGGENPDRFITRPDGGLAVSAIKQVASGRFGVTIHYLVNCNEIQIKIAQGAKPGEGGQLPGNKVSQDIAKVRYSTPGVTLISPPPHHDIYSIEDLAQLIFDLKNANPEARITVKLVSEAGVGTIAAGVAKAHADMIVIAGHDGGTGASPLTSTKHAGAPWELGLSETHQTLVLNGLRSRVRLQTDGQLKSGRDVAIAALLGAEEFGFATTPLITIGCIMMRKCHLNTCPVGVATQDPVLRKKFTGQPENVINFFFFVAEEVRKIMASLGFRKFDDMIGRTDMLQQIPDLNHWKAKYLDLSAILYQPPLTVDKARYCTTKQNHGLQDQLDKRLIEMSTDAIEQKKPVAISMPIRNTNRTVGTMLSSKIARKHGMEGLPDNTLQCHFTGSAGQSFGAFLAHGVTLTLEGDANDYVGKGLSGGRIIVSPPKISTFKADENIIIGNTVLYGAIAGEAFFAGVAGERFAVRNSGATAVVEGVGDHGCEYMTGGRVIVLGETGRNFAAGMSGGIAYVLDRKGTFQAKCNTQMVELGPIADREEQQWVHSMLERHYQYTRSVKAKTLLDEWEQTLPRFVRIMPTEYRLVLEKEAAEKLRKTA
ncbi:MAG: glutamate synthase large subunit [SAR324 cluster bacterium]|nr:glutamate synthase large subunit [SAR324 cluster bacterium]